MPMPIGGIIPEEETSRKFTITGEVMTHEHIESGNGKPHPWGSHTVASCQEGGWEEFPLVDAERKTSANNKRVS